MIDTQVPLFDLHLMLAANGKERTVAEYSILTRLGNRLARYYPLSLKRFPEPETSASGYP
jgi:hypothetical protein